MNFSAIPFICLNFLLLFLRVNSTMFSLFLSLSYPQFGPDQFYLNGIVLSLQDVHVTQVEFYNVDHLDVGYSIDI